MRKLLKVLKIVAVNIVILAVLGTPVFTRDGEATFSNLLVTNPTNPNAEEHTAR